MIEIDGLNETQRDMISNKKLREMHDIVCRVSQNAPGSHEWSQKFGELILRECLYIIENKGTLYHRDHFAQLIREYFEMDKERSV